MRFLGKDDSSFYSNALPQGLKSRPELIEAYRKALNRHADASEAWGKLMTTHIESGSQWSAIMHCALASGMTSEDLRLRLGASPSTLSRWFDGLVQPTRMLRDRLEKELIELAQSIVTQVRDASSQLPDNTQTAFALAAAGPPTLGPGAASQPRSAIRDTYMCFVDRLGASIRIFVDDSGVLYVTADKGVLPKIIDLQSENETPIRLGVEAPIDGFARLSGSINLVELREKFADEDGQILVFSL